MPTATMALLEAGPNWIIGAGFILGALVGSFLNVCIARLPRGESISSPPSHCPRCNAAIAPYDNIPLLSYALLRGRCRSCGVHIAWRYPLIELLTAILFAAVVATFGLSAWTAASLVFVAALVVIAFIDIDHQIIPNRISLPGIVIGLGLAAIASGPHSTDLLVVLVLSVLIVLTFSDVEEPLLAHRIALPLLILALALAAFVCGGQLRNSVLGVLLGGGILWAVAAGYEWLRGQEGMGGGDIKLLAMIGACLGWRAVFVTIMIGSLAGALIGSIHLWLQRGGDTQVPIPFGPFLALGAFIALLYGDQLIHWYLMIAFG